jgi:hypothetical protein
MRRSCRPSQAHARSPTPRVRALSLPQSCVGPVLRKLGMRHEGTLRQHVRKWDVLEDIEGLGMLVREWQGVQPG